MEIIRRAFFLSDFLSMLQKSCAGLLVHMLQFFHTTCTAPAPLILSYASTSLGIYLKSGHLVVFICWKEFSVIAGDFCSHQCHQLHMVTAAGV